MPFPEPSRLLFFTCWYIGAKPRQALWILPWLKKVQSNTPVAAIPRHSQWKESRCFLLMLIDAYSMLVKAFQVCSKGMLKQPLIDGVVFFVAGPGCVDGEGNLLCYFVAAGAMYLGVPILNPTKEIWWFGFIWLINFNFSSWHVLPMGIICVCYCSVPRWSHLMCLWCLHLCLTISFQYEQVSCLQDVDSDLVNGVKASLACRVPKGGVFKGRGKLGNPKDS